MSFYREKEAEAAKKRLLDKDKSKEIQRRESVPGYLVEKLASAFEKVQKSKLRTFLQDLGMKTFPENVRDGLKLRDHRIDDLVSGSNRDLEGLIRIALEEFASNVLEAGVAPPDFVLVLHVADIVSDENLMPMPFKLLARELRNEYAARNS